MNSEQHGLNNAATCRHPAYDVGNINKPNDNGETALHIAARKGCRYCCEILIKSGANLAAKNENTPTPFNIIYTKIDKPVDFLINIFNKCINYESQYKQKSYGRNDNFKLDFTPLIPLNDDNQMGVIINLLKVIKDKKQRNKLMDHPLIKSFLELKWSKVKNYYYATILAYMVFVGLLSAYSMILINSWLKESKSTAFQIIRWLVVVAVMIMVIQAVVQGYYLRKVYFKQLETYVHLGTVITSLMTTVCITKDTKYWILHAASIAIFLAWVYLLMLMGRIKKINYFTLLFKSVFKKVCKMMGIFSIVLFGFTLSFSVQFHEEFRYIWKAFVKTFTMMTGEYHYDDLFNLTCADEPNPDFIHGLTVTSTVLFLSFVTVSNITFMNLVMGLSISDIQLFEKEGDTLKLEKQGNFLKHVENLNWSKKLFGNIDQEVIINFKKDVGNAIWKILSYETFVLIKMQAEANKYKNENKINILNAAQPDEIGIDSNESII